MRDATGGEGAFGRLGFVIGGALMVVFGWELGGIVGNFVFVFGLVALIAGATGDFEDE